MRGRDLMRFVLRAVTAQRRRSFLTALGIGVGVAAVVLLTSIGEGTYRHVLGKFTQFGTHVLSVHPGKTTTHGVPGAMFGTVRPLTLEDAEALRGVPYVVATIPVVQGNAEVEAGPRKRRTTVYGVGPDVPTVWRFGLSMGEFLPHESDLRSARSTAVLGAKLRRELFAERSPLGERIRVGGQPYRVVGVVEPKGQLLGFDLDDGVHIPAARALELFNREGVMNIDVRYKEGIDVKEVTAAISRLLVTRHGKDDFTIVTQDQMLDVLRKVLGVLTFAVAALGSISLVVGGVGILTMMTIAARERTAEIGVLRALGAEQGQVLRIFLAEAALVGALGGIVGLVLGAGGAQLLRLAVPGLPVHTPWSFAVLAEATAILIGLFAGVLPARQAARLDPVEALRSE
jgi:putative ABC transport system permease protein